MLPIRCEKLYTPPSSPASLSSSWPNSSSPPSSPTFEPVSLRTENGDENEQPVTRVIDPFAGSYNGIRTKRTSPLFTPHHSPNKKPRYLYQLPLLEDENLTDRSQVVSPSVFDKESSIFEDTFERVFATGIRNIDLGCNLTYIQSRFISDLNKVVVLPEVGETFDDSCITLSVIKPAEIKRRPYTRVQTAPASTGLEWGSTPHMMQKKSASSNHILSGASREHVDLYFGNNSITKLPAELWNLRNLRILSLRNNNIKYLPPELAKLENLVDLNVALNKLSFLPSELTSMMSLTKLIVLPNPFLPESCGGASRTSETHQTGSRVPPLTELALRVIFSPPILPSEKETLFEEGYQLPIPTGGPYRPISGPLRNILATCVPGSVATDDDAIWKEGAQEGCEEVTGIGKCPNPVHKGLGSIFVHHVEERFTWVDSILGIKLGGLAPLRWRGCQWGCLNFLDPIKDQEQMEDGNDETSVVKTVNFAVASLEFDDD